MFLKWRNEFNENNAASSSTSLSSSQSALGVKRSLSAIISSLPPLKGPKASLTTYLRAFEKVCNQLDLFFGSDRYMRRLWDLKKAQEAEYCIMTDRLMKMFGGSIGRRRREDENILIAVGNSDFTNNKGLSSMDGSFLSFFVQKVSTQAGPCKVVCEDNIPLLIHIHHVYCALAAVSWIPGRWSQ